MIQDLNQGTTDVAAAENGHPGGLIAAPRANLNSYERRVLRALVNIQGDYGDFCFASFQSICRRTRLNRKIVRRSCRSLARKALAEYGKGLFTDDGEVAGSGYAATRAGARLIEAMP